MPDDRNVGEFRQAFDIQGHADTTSPLGQKRPEWTTIKPGIRGKIRQLTAREQFNAERVRSTATHRVVMRWVMPLAALKNRLVMGGRIFNIQAAVDPDEMNEWYDLDVVEVLNPG